jgi:hypothetical protein
MVKIFISYRREDSAAHVGRLFDELRRKFGRSAVFMDIDTIEPGHPFAERIATSVKSANVVLVAIGRRWLEVTDPDGRRRIDKPDDFVRLEIETALASSLRVIPVLFGGAKPPAADALPELLRPLAALQTTEISDTRFPYDADRLVRSINRDLKRLDRLQIYAMRRPVHIGALLLTLLVGGMVLTGREWMHKAANLTNYEQAVRLDEGTAHLEPQPRISETAARSPAHSKVAGKPNPSSVLDVETFRLKREIDLYGLISDLITESTRTGRALGTIGVHLTEAPGNAQVYISSVVPKSAAVRAGLFAGDVLTTIDGLPVMERSQVTFDVLNLVPGSTHMVAVRRGTRELAFPVVADVMGESDLSELKASIEDRARAINRYQQSGG